MGIKFELDYHQEAIDEAKEKENKAFHAMLELVRSLGGKQDDTEKAISLWVDGTMASSDEGWHRHNRYILKQKVDDIRKCIRIEDLELLK